MKLDMGGNKKQSKKLGFSLVEVVIVITIIGILAAIITVTFDNVRKASRTSERETDIEMISNALEKYYDENGEYPAPAHLVNNNGNISGGYVTHEVLPGLPAEALVAPLAPADTTNSLTLLTDYSYESMDVDSYGYSISFSANPDYCLNDSMSCSNYVLLFKDEVSGVLKTKCSQHGKTSGMPCGTGFAVASSCPAGQVGSPPNCALPDYYKPATPLTPSASANTTTATFTWSPVATATGYKVEKRINGGPWILVSSSQSGTTAAITANGTDLVEVRVSSKYNNNTSLPSGIASARIVLAAPSTPINPAYTTTTLTFSWNGPSAATAYRIEKRVNSGSWTLVNASYASSSIVISGNPADLVEIRVYSLANGYTSVASGVGAGRMLVDSPTISLTRINGLKAYLSWNAVSGASSYQLIINSTTISTTATSYVYTGSVGSNNTAQIKSVRSGDGWVSPGTSVAVNIPSSVVGSASGNFTFTKSAVFANTSTMNTTRQNSIVSPNGRYVAIWQWDGNFVVYDLNTGSALGATATNGATTLVLQQDGNLVIYNGSTVVKHTDTYGSPYDYRLVMQDDANLVNYQVVSGVHYARWARIGNPKTSGPGLVFMQ